ncbi:GTP-binding protein [Melghirimyces thermohalophilus]|uniref:Probable GTP-binding protein EngB n=1 Tax=Melghirimyces thermohalophilus TaxID=1236220 RepID=A0A1G6JQX6_9BACL|nr:ribosome biogenesis GTP-binding protein YihA/YsxC [Melghirimyces thermohalophilus]SDC21124.1 GTP-binding protein [Melghirimyces thermohalophilus]
MKVTQAELVISAVKPAQYPTDALPEIALAGRSNVGKSSLINRLINRKNLARTSSRPGKTQTLNFYRINNQLYFADMPGYGFARVPQSVKAAWGRMIEGYLSSRERLCGVIQLIDLRHPPTRDDRTMYDYLKHYDLPTIVVATKADKITRGRRQQHLKEIRKGIELDPSDPLLPFSSQTGQGKEELWKEIRRLTEADSRF